MTAQFPAPPSSSGGSRPALCSRVQSYTNEGADAKDAPLTFPPHSLLQADRDQLYAAISFTKVQVAAMRPLVTGIYQQTVHAAMQVGFRVLGFSIS